MPAGLLHNRALIRLGGADRVAFLQGLISNDVNACSGERAIYAALLTPQGKFLHDLFAIAVGDELLIDCEAARIDDLINRLAAYKLRAKISLQKAEELEVWAVWNSTDPGLRRDGLAVCFDPRLTQLGHRAIVEKGTAIDCERVDFSEYDKHRLALGIADGSRDMIVEKSTLSDGNFDLLNGISWTKGCYIGQELTARMHYRALVKKRMFPVRIEGAAPEFGAIIKLGNDDAGDMRSACGDYGLALLSIEKAETAIRENAPLNCGASRLMVSRPVWMKLKD